MFFIENYYLWLSVVLAYKKLLNKYVLKHKNREWKPRNSSQQTINNIHVASYKEKYRLRPILSNRPFTCMGPQIMIGLIDMNGNYENNRSFFLKRVM